MTQSTCVICTARNPRTVGVLCDACAEGLPRGSWHVPGVVRSHVRDEVANAWLIDPWGIPHAVASHTTVGREPASSVFIADREISSRHLELTLEGRTWTVRDLGSAAGTHIGKERNVRRATLTHRELLQCGPIGFYFWADRSAPRLNRYPSIGTMQPRAISYLLSDLGPMTLQIEPRPGKPLDKTNGVLRLTLPDGTRAERGLSTLQFQLLRRLCEQSIRNAYAGGDTGGFVDTAVLASALPFQTSYPSGENVRQVVHGLRRVLASMLPAGSDASTSLAAMIEGLERVGYRITWRVSYADAGET